MNYIIITQEAQCTATLTLGITFLTDKVFKSSSKHALLCYFIIRSKSVTFELSKTFKIAIERDGIRMFEYFITYFTITLVLFFHTELIFTFE